MDRKYESGAAKRKRANQQKETIVQLPKITKFFSAQGQGHAGSDETVVKEEELNLDQQTEKILKSYTPENEESAKASTSSAGQSKPLPSKDPALWDQIDEQLRSDLIRLGPEYCQNLDQDFAMSERIYDHNRTARKRRLTKTLFNCELPNGEVVERKWLLYSPSQGTVFCFACRLFSKTASSFSSAGFCDWRNASKRLQEHEKSRDHKDSMLSYVCRNKECAVIDSQLIKQFKQEQAYWQEILERLVVVIKFLASRGLAFRGDNQILGSQHNGNYLGLLEMLSQFDPLLKEHLKKYGNKGSGHTSYISANICEELITTMGQKLIQAICEELKAAKYYSISVDSTPDISHVDQLTFIVRYVWEDKPVERFLSFIPISAHTAENLANTVLSFLEKGGIPLSNCRGQSYDNASNMAGQYTGLQARIKIENEYALYVPCAGHSLNLVGQKAVESSRQSIAFFQLVQEILVFFSASTHRWSVLIRNLSPGMKTLKRLSDTRWSAHSDAVAGLCEGYPMVQKSLEELANDTQQKSETRLKASSLLSKMDRLETVFLTILWNDVLKRVNIASKTVQSNTSTLSVIVCVIESLKLHVRNLKEEFQRYETLAQEKSAVKQYSDYGKREKKRSTRISFFVDGPCSETILTGSEKFKVETFVPMIDSLLCGLADREKAYSDIHKRFGFLEELHDLDANDILEHSETLATFYQADLDGAELNSECSVFKQYLSTSEESRIKSSKCLSIQEVYTKLKKEGL